MEKFEKTPLQAVKESAVRRRISADRKIKWLYKIPGGGNGTGKKYRIWKKLKAHVEDMCQWFWLMTDGELFTILDEIEKNKVPTFFKPIVELFYDAKKTGKIISELTIGTPEETMPLFDYADPTILSGYHKGPTMGKRVIPLPSIKSLLAQANNIPQGGAPNLTTLPSGIIIPKGFSNDNS